MVRIRVVGGIAHSSSAGPPYTPPFTCAFSTWLGRNTSTRRGRIGTSWPVFGLRPIAAALLPHGKRAESADLDGFPRLQRGGDLVQQRLQQLGRIVPRQTDLRVDRFRKMSAGDGMHCGQR